MNQQSENHSLLLIHTQRGLFGSFATLIHRDSEFSVVTESYGSSTRNEELALKKEAEENEEKHLKQPLNAWQGAALLTADCLGTGLLALPDDMRVLGAMVGLGFLVANLPINYYAGWILHQTATAVEKQQAFENQIYRQTLADIQENSDYESFRGSDLREIQKAALQPESSEPNELTCNLVEQEEEEGYSSTTLWSSKGGRPYSAVHHDTATSDFIGMSSALFFQQTTFTRFVMTVFYINIFLVLGNYILVMSHALVASYDDLCLPTAGGIATILMIGITSQMRTMAKLGRLASMVSLLALAIVVGQCLWAIHHRPDSLMIAPALEEVDVSLLRKLSALGSIGFAVGSQKLFLNIRHDLADRSVAPKTLGISLSLFGLAYIGLCLGAGSNPPGFLLDAIPEHTWSKRIAGLLLFVHVVVSYSINSQALCGSLDRLVWRHLRLPAWTAKRRWFVLTTFLAITAYTVANAIPFFTDLIAFIGSISTVPLTLLFPALYWRKHQNVALWGLSPVASAALTYFAMVFAILATVGSLDSIRRDWSTHGPPFSCK